MRTETPRLNANAFTLLGMVLLSSCLQSCSSNNSHQKKENAGKSEQPSRATPPEDFKQPPKEEVIPNPGADCFDGKKVDPDKICVDLYDPVCGCNHKTYSNSCQAEKEGILKWKKGVCD